MRQTKLGMTCTILVAAAAASLALTGCGSQTEESRPAAPAAAQTAAPAPAAASEPQRYDMIGKVVAVDKEGKTLTVDHGDIPGFMMAMTMPYPVKDAALLDKVAAGDQITAKVVSAGGEYWLENVVAAPPPAK